MIIVSGRTYISFCTVKYLIAVCIRIIFVRRLNVISNQPTASAPGYTVPLARKKRFRYSNHFSGSIVTFSRMVALSERVEKFSYKPESYRSFIPRGFFISVITIWHTLRSIKIVIICLLYTWNRLFPKRRREAVVSRHSYFYSPTGFPCLQPPMTFSAKRV